SSFFFSSRRRHTRFSRDWSSDVCSSDLWTGDLRRRRVHGDRGNPLQLHRPVGRSLLVIARYWSWWGNTSQRLGDGGVRRWLGSRSEERRVGKEWRLACVAGAPRYDVCVF